MARLQHKTVKDYQCPAKWRDGFIRKPRKQCKLRLLDEAIHETSQLLVDIMRRRGNGV